jgi:hypothetical protein
MHQFTIERTSNNQQKIVSKETYKKQELVNKREDKGRSLAISRNVFRLQTQIRTMFSINLQRISTTM